MEKWFKYYDKKRVIVTGGAGFIGSHLVEKLLDLGADVTVIDSMLCGNKIAYLKGKRGLKVHKLDIVDYESIAPFFNKADIVFHLAAVVGVEETQMDPLHVLDVEIIGTANVIKLSALNRVKKYVFASSSEVYGDSKKPMVEKGPYSPRSTYALTKLVGEHYCQAYFQKYGMEYVVLRYFNCYGPRQDERFVLSRFVDRAKNGLYLPVYGDGNQTRDFTYVEDAVHMSLLAAASPSGINQEFNIGTNRTVSINTLAEMILKALKATNKVRIKHVAYDKLRSRKIEIFNRLANINKAIGLLDYEPSTPLEVGIKKYISWYNKN